MLVGSSGLVPPPSPPTFPPPNSRPNPYSGHYNSPHNLRPFVIFSTNKLRRHPPHHPSRYLHLSVDPASIYFAFSVSKHPENALSFSIATTTAPPCAAFQQHLSTGHSTYSNDSTAAVQCVSDLAFGSSSSSLPPTSPAKVSTLPTRCAPFN